MNAEVLKPKLLDTIKVYTRSLFISDLLAGIIVGIVAIPLALAFAVASGVKPEQGLFTAIIAGFAIAALGGSRAQVSGPTGAFIVVIAKIVSDFGYSGLATATFLAGGMLMLMGIFRVGGILKFVPFPLTVGFTSGIAVIIFSAQLRDFFGLDISQVPPEFVDKWRLYVSKIHTINPDAFALGAASLITLFLFPSRKIPGSLVVLLGATFFSHYFGLSVETLGSRFGEIPSVLPYPIMPDLSLSHIRLVFTAAMTIAMLGAIESLLSASVADGMLGTKHRSNMELIAQGVGNLLSPIFSGIPATGAIARTATNIKSGGKTPISAITHAVTVLLVMLLFGKYAALIPLPALSAILIYIAWNMSEMKTFFSLLKSQRGDVLVLLTTFLLTVFIDLTVAIEVGMILSALIFMKRMEETAEFSWISNQNSESEDIISPVPANLPQGVEIFRIDGPLFFGAIDRFRSAISRLERSHKILILRMKAVPSIDASGVHALKELTKSLRKRNVILILAGLKKEPLQTLTKSSLIDDIGRDNICENTQEAVKRARLLLS